MDSSLDIALKEIDKLREELFVDHSNDTLDNVMLGARAALRVLKERLVTIQNKQIEEMADYYEKE